MWGYQRGSVKARRATMRVGQPPVNAGRGGLPRRGDLPQRPPGRSGDPSPNLAKSLRGPISGLHGPAGRDKGQAIMAIKSLILGAHPWPDRCNAPPAQPRHKSPFFLCHVRKPLPRAGYSPFDAAARHRVAQPFVPRFLAVLMRVTGAVAHFSENMPPRARAGVRACALCGRARPPAREAS